MIASFSAALLKLSRRPAIWVLVAIQMALLVVLSYALLYAVSQQPPPGQGRAFDPRLLKVLLYPDHFVRQTLGDFAGFGGAIALILGVLVYGSEYGWGTVKTVFTQRPGRLATYAGTLAALALILELLVLAMFAAAALCSAGVAAADHQRTAWPSAETVLRGIAAASLIVALWAGLGVMLSVIFRQSALAIGIGLVYSLVVEGLLFGIFGRLELLRTLEKGFPGANATSLIQSFGTASINAPPATPLVGATQAALVLAAYVVLFVAVTAVLVRRRDVV